MPVFRLHRHVPLSPTEIGRLPGGTVGVRGGGDVVARAESEASFEKLLMLAFRLGAAVPDAKLSIEGATGSVAGLSSSAAGSHDAGGDEGEPEVDEHAAAEMPIRKAPLDSLRAGEIEAAAEAFGEQGLTSHERDEVRQLLQSTEPGEVALGIQASRLSNHRTYATHIRRHLRHSDTRVRLEAVLALGSLGGPSMVPALRPLVHDENEEIKAAAEAAILAIEG